MFKPTCYYYKRKSCLHTMAIAGIIISALGTATVLYLFLSCGCCKKLKSKIKQKADKLMDCDDENNEGE